MECNVQKCALRTVYEGPGRTGDKLAGGLWHRGINSYKVYHWEWLGRYYVTVSSDGRENEMLCILSL